MGPAPSGDIRILDLRTGFLFREERSGNGCPVRSLRFASLILPGVVALRAKAFVGRLRTGSPFKAPRDDPAAHLAIRYGLFQLWRNTDHHDELAVGARGRSGPGTRARARLQLRSGSPGERVADVAGAEQADLIALSWSQHLDAGWSHTVRRSVLYTGVPVLLFPAGSG